MLLTELESNYNFIVFEFCVIGHVIFIFKRKIFTQLTSLTKYLSFFFKVYIPKTEFR